MIIRNAELSGRLSDIRIENGIITEIISAGRIAKACGPVFDAAGRVVIPGLIDPHVHMRCPGMESKEDWVSGVRAALAGGVTTLIDMPNTRPATETFEALKLKREAASEADKAGYPIGRLFWAGCSPETIDELPKLLGESDVAGVKLFLSETSGNNSSSDRDFMRRVFTITKEAGKPAAVHTELAGYLNDAGAENTLSELELHNRRRPPLAAEMGTAIVLELAASTGCMVYLCHLSTAKEFEMVREHKARYGIDSVTAELTPHHLVLNEMHRVLGGPQSWAKVNPPLRAPEDNGAAFEAILDGTIDLIGSDHAPHRPEEKEMKDAPSFFSCPSGFPGLETELGIVAGRLKERTAGWTDLVSMLTNKNPARIFSLDDRNGVAVGKRADLVILGESEIVDSGKFKSKAAYSPFNGMKMQVSVYKTILGGKIIE